MATSESVCFQISPPPTTATAAATPAPPPWLLPLLRLFTVIMFVLFLCLYLQFILSCVLAIFYSIIASIITFCIFVALSFFLLVLIFMPRVRWALLLSLLLLAALTYFGFFSLLFIPACNHLLRWILIQGDILPALCSFIVLLTAILIIKALMLRYTSFSKHFLKKKRVRFANPIDDADPAEACRRKQRKQRNRHRRNYFPKRREEFARKEAATFREGRKRIGKLGDLIEEDQVLEEKELRSQLRKKTALSSIKNTLRRCRTRISRTLRRQPTAAARTRAGSTSCIFFHHNREDS